MKMNIGTWQWIGFVLYTLTCGVFVLGTKGIIDINWGFFLGFAWTVGIIFISVGINLIREVFTEVKRNE